jgi:4-amino-4-deoxy-L-arabinose transferase-like glycosyltransferase
VAARAWYGVRAAWIAAVLAALTGVLTFYEILILQAAIDPFLTAAALAALASALVEEPERSWRLAVAGAIFGLEVLNRPNVIAGLGCVALAMVVVRRWRSAAWLAAGVALALAPVVARNAIVSHQFALVSSQGGLNFFIGNNASADGRYQEVPGVRPNAAGQAEDTRRVAEAAIGHPLTDAEVSAYFSGRAWTWIRSHPADASLLFARKLALTLNHAHQWLDFSYPYYAHDTGSSLWLLCVGPWLVIPLGIAGIFIVRTPHRREYVAWTMFIPGALVGVAVFFVAERYRVPLLVAACITSGGAIDALLTKSGRDWMRDWRLERTAAVGMCVAAACVAAWWPFGLNDGRFDERLMLARVLMDRHEPADAAVELQKAREIQPGNSVVEFNLGIAQLASGQADGISHLRHAVDAGVTIPGARYVLANALLTTGDREGAARLVQTFHPLPSENAESCYHVAMLALDVEVPGVAVEFLQRAIALKPEWREPRDLLRQITGR